MALIEKSVLLGIADRSATQYGKVKVAFDTMNITGGGFYWQRVTNTDDPDVEIPLLSTYYNTDTTLTLSGTVRNGMPQLLAIATQMDQHFSRVDFSGSWDGYLTAEDERVSDYFNQVYYIAKGSYMLANNVFSETDDVFGNVEIVGGPAVQFTDGTDYGDGSSTNKADGSNFAPTQLKVVCDGAIGGSNLDLRLSVKDPDDVSTTIDVTIPSGSPDGTEIDVGTSSDRFLDVTGVAYVPAGSQGTVGDKVDIQNKKERQIAM
jgi:hypothetical protein